MYPLDGVRVLDRSTGIGGPYCAKLLADAGADVVRTDTPRTALEEYLNASKRTVPDGAHLVAGADIVVDDTPIDRTDRPALVVVTVTPFGTGGPWAGRPATEFTLQAAGGSTGARGLPDRPPLAAGGRITEWAAGAYAAVGALAALREARRSGEGEHVDVSILDTVAVTMVTFPSVFGSFLGWPTLRGTGRMIEVPSIEPTADGYAVFTTNSAQQYQDFLTMIGRPDLLEDKGLANAIVRFRRREEFLSAVHDYTTKHTTAEVLDDAAVLRVPAGPVLNGATIPEFEQFVARGVFGPSASGRFVQPRVPYRISSSSTRAPGDVAAAAEWPPRAPTAATDGWRLPLEGVRVVDCTAWWAGPVAPHALACLGADVIKVESVTRPDLMRFSGTKPATAEQWWEWGPIFHCVNTNKRGVTLNLTDAECVAVFERLVAGADMLVENYTPRVMDQFGLGWERLHALNPRLVMVRMPAFGLDGPWRDRTGFAQTMESVSGLAWLTGFADGPPVLVRGAGDPLAGVHAAFAALLALGERDRDGEGRLVESVMVEAVLNVAAEQVIEHTSSGRLLTRDGNRSPLAAPQGVYRCAGDDRWVAIAATTDEQWTALAAAAGVDADPALGSLSGRHAAHDLLDDRLGRWCAGLDADEVADGLVAAGVPAAVVVPARDGPHNPQMRWRGLWEEEDHPVTGRHELPSLPFRYSHVERWHRRPSPTLGQHNDEVLESLGLDRPAIASLRARGAIGEKLA